MATEQNNIASAAATATAGNTRHAGQDGGDDGLTPVSVADHLEQDPPIRGQRFACMSFVSPSDAIKAKDAFIARRFMLSLAADVRGTIENIEGIFGTHKAVSTMLRMLREKHAYLWDESAAQTEYALFREQQSEDLDRGFREAHGSFKTSVHGFKIRGVYDTVEDATERAKLIKKFDEKFNVFVAEVGCWCPWNPSTAEIKDVEYAETQLNTLMKKYDEAQDAKAEVYDNRKRDLIAEMDSERAEMQKQIQAEIFERDQRNKDEQALWEAERDKAAAAAAAAAAESPASEAPVPAAAEEAPVPAAAEEAPVEST